MSLINRVALLTAGNWFFLPPYKLSVNPYALDMGLGLRPIPRGGKTVLTYRECYGRTIQISGQYRAATISAGIGWQDSLVDALLDATGHPRPVELSRWIETPSGGGQTKIYRSCYCTTPPLFSIGAPGTEQVRDFSFALKALDPAVYGTSSVGTIPGTSTYETDYPGGVPGGGGYVPIDQIVIYPFAFDETVEAIGSGNADRMQFVIPIYQTTATMYLKQVVIDNALKPDSGSSPTIITASNKVWNGGSPGTVTASLPAASTAAAGSVGTVNILDGNIYVYPSAAGGHARIKGHIICCTV